MPVGTLREALEYPREKLDIPDDRLKAVMEMVGLGAFAGRLDEPDNWAQRLSLGEQQRLSFARVLLTEPNLSSSTRRPRRSTSRARRSSTRCCARRFGIRPLSASAIAARSRRFTINSSTSPAFASTARLLQSRSKAGSDG